MHALKTIQKFWKRKYAEIKLNCLIKIQRNARQFLKYLNSRKSLLNKIRIRLLMIKIKRKMILFLKKKRILRSKIRPNILSLVSKNQVSKIQGLIRSKLAKKKARFLSIINKFRIRQRVIRYLRVRTLISRANREKETYFVSRYALAKVEVDQIMKYVQKAEQAFEINWVTYE